MIRINGFTRLLILALPLLLLVGCTTNPYTKRSQLVMMSENEETQLGVAAFQQQLQQSNGKIVTDPKVTGPILTVAQRIIDAAKRSKYADTANRFQWKVVVINENVANASCLPGGKITVYTGILPYAGNDDGLAAILGHEVTHALAHHAAERMSQSTLTKLGMATAQAAMAAKGVNSYSQQSIMQAVGLGAQYGVLLPFSREHESEADYIGLLLAAQAGYDPREAVKVWQRMEQSGGRQPLEFMSTHPSHGTRIKQLESWMPEAMTYYNATQKSAGDNPNSAAKP